MNHYPLFRESPEQQDEQIVARPLRNKSPIMNDPHSSSNVSPGMHTKEKRGFRVNECMGESPQQSPLKKRPAHDRNQSTTLPHWNGHDDETLKAPMGIRNEDSSHTLNESRVSDTARMDERYRNSSQSEAPDYSRALCMNSFGVNSKEPGDDSNARLVGPHESTNVRGDTYVPANNSTAYASHRESNPSQEGREVLAESPKVYALHPGMFSKRTALVDRLIETYENLPMFQRDGVDSSTACSRTTLTEPTTTDACVHHDVVQTSTPPPPEDTREDGMLEKSGLLQAELTHEEEKEGPTEASNARPSKIQKVSDERGTDSDTRPGSPNVEEFRTAWSENETTRNGALGIRGGSVNSHKGNKKFRHWVHERTNEYKRAATKKEKGNVARKVVDLVHSQDPAGRFLLRDANAPWWVETNDSKAMEKTKQALRQGAPEPDRSVGAINKTASTEQVPSPRHKQPSHSDGGLRSPSSRQIHSQIETSHIPARMHPRDRLSVSGPPHWAANQLVRQMYGTSFALPLGPYPMPAPRRQKRPPVQPRYPIVEITVDEWNRMIKRLKYFKHWNGHCSVKRHDNVDPELGDWVYKLRQLRSTKMFLQYHKKRPADSVTEASLKVLSEDRIAELVALGFNWYESEETTG